MIPELFDDAPLHELILPFERRTISILALKDACALHSDIDPGYDVYWAELWPAAVALADAIFSGAIEIPNAPGPVLEVGCGTGLVSIAIALMGKEQRRVTASDREFRALRLTEENARRNGVPSRITTLKLDWREKYPGKHTLILAGDCLYHADSCWQLAAFLRDALSGPQARAYVVDPDRWSARNFNFLAQEAGLRVTTFRRSVPFVTANGPIRDIPAFGVQSTQQPIETTFYELSLA